MHVAVAVLMIAAAADGWEVVSKQGDLVISARAKPGSEVKEVLAVSTIDAPPWVVKNVIDDVARYTEFMPYTAVSKVWDESPSGKSTYQLLKMPFVSDRDYVLRIRDLSKRMPDGKIVYKNAWSPAKGGPPPKEGVVRLVVNEGYWQLEEKDGGEKTKATYYVYTDPGGSLPAFAVNAANTQAIPDLFEAVAAQTKDPRYRAKKPVLPGDVVTPPTTGTPPPPAVRNP